MNAAVMDTLEASRGLEAAGVERGHAEAMVEMVAAATAASREDLATKADLAVLKAELKAEFAAAADKIMLNQILAGAALLAAMVLLSLL